MLDHVAYQLQKLPLPSFGEERSDLIEDEHSRCPCRCGPAPLELIHRSHYGHVGLVRHREVAHPRPRVDRQTEGPNELFSSPVLPVPANPPLTLRRELVHEEVFRDAEHWCEAQILVHEPEPA